MPKKGSRQGMEFFQVLHFQIINIFVFLAVNDKPTPLYFAISVSAEGLGFSLASRMCKFYAGIFESDQSCFASDW
jgi:hypothetical protein